MSVLSRYLARQKSQPTATRSSVGFRPRLIVPFAQSIQTRRKPRGPMCMRCTLERAQAAGRGKNYIDDDECWILHEDAPSDREEDLHRFELVPNTEGMPRSHILIRCRHHRQEMVVRFDMGTEHYQMDDIDRAAKTMIWFAPEDMVQT